jgi:O-antigen/teichoic acid export membrane protein
MKKLFKKLFSDSLIYGLSGIISSFISIFLIPLYTRIFDPSDYGIMSLLLTTFALLNLVILFSLDNSTVVWFWDKPDTDERKKTFTSWVVFNALAGLTICFLLIILSRPLSNLYFGKPDYYLLFILLGVNLVFSGFQKISNIWCRMLQKPFLAMFYSTVLLLVTVGCNVILVLYLRVGIKGIFISNALASFTGFLMLLIFFGSWLKFSLFSKKRITEMIKFSFPLVPAILMTWVMNAASVFFIKFFVKDNAEIGLFQIGLSVSSLLGLITWSFFQAWPAFALSVAKQENAGKIYSITMELYCILGVFISLSLFLTAKDILLIFTNEKYVGAKDVIGFLAVNIVLQGIPNIIAIANFITKKNNSYAIAVIIGSLVSILGFVILIPIFGKEGAAIAMVIGNLVVPVFLIFKAQKLYYIPYKFDRIIGLCLVQLACFALAGYIFDGIWVHLAAILVIAVMMMAYYYRVAKKNGVLDMIMVSRKRPSIAPGNNP